MIEFLVTISLTIGFIMLFVQMAMNATTGYLLHYATFMSARAYLVSDNNQVGGEGDAKRIAEEVYARYNLFGGFSKVEVNSVEDNIPSKFIGVYSEITPRFSIGFIGGKSRMKLRSEAFLGREPNKGKCWAQIVERLNSLSGAGESFPHQTIYDDGC